MKLTAEYKKGACQCRNRKCNHVFQQSEAEYKLTERFEQQVSDSVCPKCGSTYGSIDYPITEEELLYKNGKFHANYNRELKLHMDQVTEGILERDRRKLVAIRKAEKINKRYIERCWLGA